MNVDTSNSRDTETGDTGPGSRARGRDREISRSHRHHAHKTAATAALEILIQTDSTGTLLDMQTEPEISNPNSILHQKMIRIGTNGGQRPKTEVAPSLCH